MPKARLHDGSAIEVQVYGQGPAMLLPVNPRPVEGPQADELRRWGNDPALGRSLIDGLADAYRVVAFDAPSPEERLITCDLAGAAEALGFDPEHNRVAVYFDSAARAQEFVAVYDRQDVGSAEVTTYCLD